MDDEDLMDDNDMEDVDEDDDDMDNDDDDVDDDQVKDMDDSYGTQNVFLYFYGIVYGFRYRNSLV